MGQPAAKQNDRIIGNDIHLVLVGTNPPAGVAHPFSGMITGGLSTNVRIMGLPAATVDSTALNVPPHVPALPGGSFVKPPANQATIKFGSATVKINGKAVARNGDAAMTCNDPTDLPNGKVLATGSVLVG